MANKTKLELQARQYIQPLNVNGLNGRMLRVPAKRKDRQREILLIYGHHALLERWWGLVENLNDYGPVTMPDLPGFGGMDSFSKIGRKPTLDNYADYLAAFIKMRYRRKKVTIIGISYGFVVATRMLLRYPELASKVNLLTSVVGFMHKDDFLFSPLKRRFFSGLARLFATRPIAFFIRYCCLNALVIKNIYPHFKASKKRFIEVGPAEFASMLDFEVKLWQANDVRTHWLTTSEFLRLDNCKSKVNLDVWHVASKGDHYFNNQVIEQHMRIVFKDYHQMISNTKAHTPSVLADKKGMSVFVPRTLRTQLLRKK